MSAATDALENDLVDLIFNNNSSTLAIGAGSPIGLQPSASAGSLYVALHTGTLGENPANQAVNEATYTGYGRQAVARTSGGWTVSGSSASNTAEIKFGSCTAGSDTLTHYSIGTDATGSSQVLFTGALTSSIAVSSGIEPRFAINQLEISVD